VGKDDVKPVHIGIIGCGVISDSYLRGAAGSRLVKVKAVADLKIEAAQARAGAYGVEAVAVDALLNDPDIDIVLNLTVPLVHAQVSRQVIAAGKHVYSEKPLATDFADARDLVDAARAKGVRIGSAPDTFLGAAHQACRRLIDEGRIGKVVAGSAAFMNRSSAAWHTNPGFFVFKKGGGPMLDMGPYYVTQLVNLLGPVARVTAVASNELPVREVVTGPLKGSVIRIEVPATINGVLEFVSGANIAITTSWEVQKHSRPPFELYGAGGTLIAPDPNFFGGTPRFATEGGDWQELAIADHPFGIVNHTIGSGERVADYRIVGVIDMAAALREGRPHRASGELALHVLEVLESFGRSSVEGRHVVLSTRCARPAAVPLGEDEAVFARFTGQTREQRAV
jgi:predicted dehydrogenase